MTESALPLVERLMGVGPLRVTVHAAVDQDALLRATQTRDAPPFGLMLWESAVVLARHVATLDLSGASVLELGAGVGLTGIVAALAGGCVTQTDHDPLALKVCARNAAANGVTARVTQKLCDWHTWRPNARFDIILGADVLYDRDDHAAIERSMREALAPGGRVYLADPNRAHTAEFLARLEAEQWQVAVDHRQTPDLTRADTRVDVQIFTLRKTGSGNRSG